MSTVIEVVAPRLLGPALMVAAAIIVKGYADVGDGFCAGRDRRAGDRAALRHASAASAPSAACPSCGTRRRSRRAACCFALAVGFFPVAAGDPPFTHLPPPARTSSRSARSS